MRTMVASRCSPPALARDRSASASAVCCGGFSLHVPRRRANRLRSERAADPACGADAAPGQHTFVSRAIHADGRVQPTSEDLAGKKTFLEDNSQHPRTVVIA